MSHPLFHRHPQHIAEGLIASGIWNEDTAWGWLDDWARQTPDKPAIIESPSASVSYGELSDQTKRFANGLKNIGIRKGDVVAIQLPSSIEFLIAYFGVTRAGAILATLHMPYRDGELEPLLRFSHARAIICGPSTGKYDGPHMMRRLSANLPDLEHIIVARGREPGEGWLHMRDMIDAASAAPLEDRPSASDPALMCFTSGTSSAPKAVIHSFETLAADARAYVRTIGKTERDKTLIAPPFTHIFGLECTNNIVLTGGTIIPLDQFTPERFLTLIHEFGPSIIYGAPAHLAASLRSGFMEGRDLSSVRQVILGGSICPPHIAKEFEAQLPNGRVGILFGMTETLLITQTPFDASEQARHATVGKPVPGIDLRILDLEGRPVGPGEEGELQVRGFSVMSGYVANPQANARSFTQDGWFRTGDLACWDDEGNVRITGRLVEVINRGGVKINPTDLESAIAQHEAVVDVAVIPIPDEILGERICAVVTLAKGMRLDLPDLCAFLQQEKIAKARWPERLVVLDSLPMTPTKKVIKGALRKLVEQQLESEPG